MLKIPAFSKVKNDPIIHFLYDSTYTSSTPIRFSPRINLSANLKTHEVRNTRNFGLLPYLGPILTKNAIVQTRVALRTDQTMLQERSDSP